MKLVTKLPEKDNEKIVKLSLERDDDTGIISVLAEDDNGNKDCLIHFLSDGTAQLEPCINQGLGFVRDTRRGKNASIKLVKES